MGLRDWLLLGGVLAAAGAALFFLCRKQRSHCGSCSHCPYKGNGCRK